MCIDHFPVNEVGILGDPIAARRDNISHKHGDYLLPDKRDKYLESLTPKYAQISCSDMAGNAHALMQNTNYFD
jgi:hypothetical protein